MIEDDPTPNPVDEALTELAGMDLSLVRHIHAQALAATDPDQINGLGRTYQRIARSLRQTLALQAKLARDERLDRERAPRRHPLLDEIPAPDQAYDVADAVTRVVWAEYESEPLECETLLDDLAEKLVALVKADAFNGEEDTDDMVRGLCNDLGLPPETAARWEELPALPAEHQVYYDLTRRGPS